MGISRRAISTQVRGSGLVLIGVGVNGAATYAMLLAARRSIGPEEYGRFAVFWAALFLLGSGLFQPLEFIVSRLTAVGHDVTGNRRFGVPAVVVAPILGLAATTVGLVLVLPMVVKPFTMSDAGLLILLIMGLAGFCGMEFLRGLQAGFGRFGLYSATMFLEGGSRIVLAGLLFALGSQSAFLFALAVVISVGMVGATSSRTVAKPPQFRGERVVAGHAEFGLLLMASLAEAIILNIGPIAVSAVDAGSEAGRYLNGVVLARIPLLLFMAVKAPLLPHLAWLWSTSQHSRFRSVLGRVVLGAAGVTVLTGILSGMFGPSLVRWAFGDTISSLDMALLSLSNCSILIPMALAVALTAQHRDRALARAWAVGAIALFAVLVFPLGAFLRVELAVSAASISAAVVMWGLLRSSTESLRNDNEPDDGVVSGTSVPVAPGATSVEQFPGQVPEDRESAK